MTPSSDWTYAAHGGLAYPCQPGETWIIGPDDNPRVQLAIGDLYDAPPLPPARLAYIDPPWGQGPRNAFHTKAGLPPAGDDYARFLRVMLESVAQADCWAVECGAAQAKLLDAAIMLFPKRRDVRCWDVTYYGTKPSKLFTTGIAGGDPTGIDDALLPAWAIKATCQHNDLVVDPCTGRGLTAIEAIAAGCRFAGIELSPHRASVTLSKLAALTNDTPRRFA